MNFLSTFEHFVYTFQFVYKQCQNATGQKRIIKEVKAQTLHYNLAFFMLKN